MDIARAVEPQDFEAAHRLIGFLAAWGVEQMTALGLPTKDLLETYYSDTAEMLAVRFGHARAPFFIARIAGEPAGCAALHDAGDGHAELHKMFVLPAFRGNGVACGLMSTLIDEAPAPRIRAPSSGDGRVHDRRHPAP